MRSLRNLVFGILLGLTAGLWMGGNLGKEKPLFANPFVKVPLQEQLKKTGGELLDKGGEALEKGGQALKRKLGE